MPDTRQEALTPKDIPNYLKRLKAVYSNDKVGQTYITFTRTPQPETQKTEQMELSRKMSSCAKMFPKKESPLTELIISDIMRDRLVSREKAERIFNKPM